jgi:hypothetical protein
MLNRKQFYRRRLASLLALLGCAASAGTAFAGRPLAPGESPAVPELPITGALAANNPPDGAPAQLSPAPAEPVLEKPMVVDPPTRSSRSQNVTINLINRLVQKGILTKEDANDLIKQAEADAEIAKAQATAAAAAEVSRMSAQADIPQPDSDTVRVTYIPESVKAQITDQVKTQVMSQARNEGWAAPNLVPDWVQHLKVTADFRFRFEGDYFGSGNDNTGAFPNFNAINTGAPYDTSGTVFAPQNDVDKDRMRERIRVRLGVEADLGEGFTMGIRLATGENNSPVTENQSLGAANNGQGGNFEKYQIWLDRGFLKYEIGGTPENDFSLTLGRFDNPFFSTTMIWAADLGFDGLLFQGRHQVADWFTPSFAGGLFPVFNTDFNFSNTQPGKYSSTDKWLYAGQVGTDWKLNKDFNFKLGTAYYYFQNISGKLSSPFVPLTSTDQGNTDDLRPGFAQNGNTYMALRNILPTAANDFGTIDQYQYYGLATPFHELAITGRLDYNHFEPFQISLTGEWVKNLAFNQSAINAIAVNNRGSTSATSSTGNYTGGDTAWIINLKAGSAALERLGDWNVGVNYRYVESDSLVDGFTDSDFALGGTNFKGYTIFGALALSRNVNLNVKWMSSDQIAGPPLKVDILQVDVNGKF